jgi:ribonuclease E
MKLDRARVQLGKISRFGLMELSRQRLKPSLGESAHLPCPRCHGTGHIRSTESIALHILRIIQEEAMKDNSAQVVAQVPVDVATYLLNEKRFDIQSLETRLKVSVVLIPNLYLETPNYTVQRLKHDELNSAEPMPTSYKMVERPEQIDPVETIKQEANEVRVEAAVKGITPLQPAPNVEPKAAPSPAAAPLQVSQKPAQQAGLWARFKAIFTGSTPATELVEAPAKADDKKREGNRDGGRDRGDRNDRNNRRGGNDRGDRNGRGDRKDRNDRNDRGDRKDRNEGRRDERKDGAKPAQGERAPREAKAAIAASGDANVVVDNKPPREQREPRGDRGERGERGSRRERGERPARDANAAAQNAEQTLAAATPVASQDASDANAVEVSQQERTDRPPRGERGARRRDRGDRGERGERAPRPEGDASESHSATPPADVASVAPQAAAPVTAAPQYVAPAPAPVVAAPAPAPVAPPEPKREAPKPFTYALPSDAGLQLMETKTTSAPTAYVTDEPVKRGRARPPRAEAPAEPMQMVETGKTGS